MRRIREVDTAQTVLMMQVENEPGLLGAARDRSALAEAAFAAPVPAELLAYLAAHRDALVPEMARSAVVCRTVAGELVTALWPACR